MDRQSLYYAGKGNDILTSTEKDLKQAREEIEVLKAKLEKCKEQVDFMLDKIIQTGVKINKKYFTDACNEELSSITIDSIKRGE